MNSCLSLLNRSIPFFPKKKVEVKPKEHKHMVLEAPSEEEISGMAITKLLDTKGQITLNMKIKFIRNRAMFTVTNDTHKTVTFDPTQMPWHCRFKIPGVLQNKAGSSATKPESYIPL